MKNRTNKLFSYLLGAMLILSGLPTGSAFAQFRFEEATLKSHFSASSSQAYQVGPGCVVFDFDNDGWDDIYTAGGVGNDHLWRNMHDGTFMSVEDSNFQVKFNTGSYSRGGSAFDFDNDGLTDLYICCQRHDILLKNMGNGVFKDVSKIAGIQTPVSENESNSSTFGDFDGDGDNDLFVARWVEEFNYVTEPGSGPTGYAHKGFPDFLYINNGNGTFTESAMPYHVDGDTGCGNIALFFDIDRDGDLDLLVGNDFGTEEYYNHVYKNMLMETGKATFVDVTDSLNMGRKLFCMGIGPCDYDRDGKFDFYETTIGPEELMHNMGDHFENAAVQANIPNGKEFGNQDYMTVTWTPVLYDFDNDGWEDGFIVHGYEAALVPYFTNDPDTSEFIRNVGGVFEQYTDTAGISLNNLNLRARGGAGFDYDHDGFVDILYGALSLVSGLQSKDFRIFHNITPTVSSAPSHSIELKFHAKRTAKEGIGTIVDVWAGGICHSRQVNTGGGFTSMTMLTQHVGLGQYSTVDSMIVYWPADKNLHRQIDRYYNVKADRILTIEEKMDATSPGMMDSLPLFNKTLSAVKSANEPTALSVYPQPASSAINIVGLHPAASVTYEIYDLLGQLVEKGVSSSQPMFVSLQHLRSGCYTIHLSSDTESISTRFVKE